MECIRSPLNHIIVYINSTYMTAGMIIVLYFISSEDVINKYLQEKN